MAKEIAISVQNVSKTFRTPHERLSSLKQNAVHLFSPKNYTEFKAVNNVSFEVQKGEFFGIVGRNGCGKSTLLKMLAGIYVPSSGHIKINGNLSPFIELGVGFNPELTARENVFLNGSILGLTRKQVEEKFESIIQFAELEDFVDQKLKNYSSGMQVRLAFSIAIQAQADILLIDEVLAVGDASFQKKCFDVFRRLKAEGRTIVFVTHDMASVRDFCDRVLVMKDGSELALVGPDQAGDIYSQLNADNSLKQLDEEIETVKRWGSEEVRATSVTLLDEAGKPVRTLRSGGSYSIRINIKSSGSLPSNTELLIGLALYGTDGLHIAGPNSKGRRVTVGARAVDFRIPQLPLPEGGYLLTVAIFNKTATKTYDFIDRGVPFAVTGTSRDFGNFILFGDWSTETYED